MANTKTIQRSFHGGELSPEMYGRIDDVVYQSGLALCENFIIRPHGPAINRSGLKFVKAVKDSAKATRMIPFTFSPTQTFAIEMGEKYMRFHTLGATLILAATPPAWLTGTAYVIGQMVAQSGSNYYCKLAHTSGTFATDLTNGKWQVLPADGTFEVATPYLTADVFDVHYVQSSDVMTFTHPNYPIYELRRYANFGDGNPRWEFVQLSFANSISAPTGINVTREPALTTTKYTYWYTVTAIGADGISESVAGTPDSVGSNLFETGVTNIIDWTSVSGATRYNVYKRQGGLYGYIGSTPAGVVQMIDDNIAPDMSRVPPIYDTVFASSNNYPGAVSYYEQRRCFGGTINLPSNLWMSKSGTETNFSYSLPIKDDDRIAVRVAARESNLIRHIVPLSQLILLTNSAEWKVQSVNSDAITPTSISVKPQSYIGSSNVQPCIVNNSLVYCAARGGHVRELGYNWQSSGFVTGDVSLRAIHLFDNLSISDMCYSKAPQPILWFVSSAGNLLGFTYVPEQQIGAWHQHTTDGVFESCTSVAEGAEDILYVVVRREINGSTVRYVERMAERVFAEVENGFFVDSGLSYDGTNALATTMALSGGSTYGPEETLTLTANAGTFVYPAQTDVDDAIVITDADGVKYTLTILSTSSTMVASVQTDKIVPVAARSATADWAFARISLAGLGHLEGETLSVLADGAVMAQKVVDSGAITLDSPAVIVHAGLPIVADLKTLPAVMQITGAGAGRFKNVNKVWVLVDRASGVWVGPDDSHLVEYKQRTTEPYGSPASLRTDELEIVLTPQWGASGQVYLRHSDPLPISVLALTLEVALGG